MNKYLLMALIIICGWVAYNSLEFRIIKLEKRNLINIHFIKEGDDNAKYRF